MRKYVSLIGQLVLAVLILGGAAAVFKHLRRTAPAIGRAKPVKRRQQVEYLVARKEDHPVRVRAHGVLVAAQEVTLRPEVVGPVTWMSPKLVPGQRVRAGEVLLKIDERDYRFALSRAEAGLEQAEQNLDLEEGRHRIAKKEWNLFQDQDSQLGSGPRSGASRRLALRLPQLVNARSAVASARSAFDEATLDLERTRVKAPFNALVQAKRAELGQHVTAQTELVHLVGTDVAWVELPLTPRQLSRLELPEVNGGQGANGTVTAQIAGREVSRSGKVLHLLPRVDQGVRLARVLVEVDDPFGHESGNGMPLLLGEYCEVELGGTPLVGVISLPRGALHERGQLYLLDGEDRLVTRTVSTVWEEDDRVWIAEGLEPGERVIVSHVPAPVPGMKLEASERPVGGEATS